MRKALLPLLLSLLLLGGCTMPELPPLPTVTPKPTDSPTPAMAAAPTASPGPTPEPTPTPAPEPTPRVLREPAINTDCIDRSFFEPSEEPGELDIVEYQTTDYATGLPATKRLAVYLPYGYDEDARYNVLFLLHTSGGNEKTWLVHDHEYRYEDGVAVVSAKNMLDNLIQQGFCEPLIVVAPSGYLDESAFYAPNNSQNYEQFDHEFSQDILPFMAEHYATYAEGGSHEQLVAARRHFGVLGASYGAYMNYISILATHMDLVANYCLIGGGGVDYGYCYERWANRGYLDYDIDCLYLVEGEYDDRYGAESSYIGLRSHAADFFSDENLHYSIIYGVGHEPRSWVNGLFNSAQIFFREGQFIPPYNPQ